MASNNLSDKVIALCNLVRRAHAEQNALRPHHHCCYEVRDFISCEQQKCSKKQRKLRGRNMLSTGRRFCLLSLPRLSAPLLPCSPSLEPSKLPPCFLSSPYLFQETLRPRLGRNRTHGLPLSMFSCSFCNQVASPFGPTRGLEGPQPQFLDSFPISLLIYTFLVVDTRSCTETNSRVKN